MTESQKSQKRQNKQKKDAADITNRLKRVEGQLRGIIRMIEDDRGCEEILIQISSVKSALHKTGQVLFENHVHQCVMDYLPQDPRPDDAKTSEAEANEVDTDKKTEEIFVRLSSAIEQFSRLV